MSDIGHAPEPSPEEMAAVFGEGVAQHFTKIRGIQKNMSRPISQYSTPRKCSVCLQPATVWVLASKDIYGSPNKSSVQPRCNNHDPEAEK
jgi:hypothetical protein